MSETLDLERKKLKLLRRQRALLEAKNDLLRYCQLQKPDPSDFDDSDLSRYDITPQARLLCKIMEDVESGKRKRVAVSIGPQLGKSEILSRTFPAWCTGRDPYRNLMLGTYNQTFAEEFGNDVRSMIASSVHQSIFPGHELQKGALHLLMTEQGGKTAFVGVGGSGTGKPADFFVVDDPIRSDEDAQSAAYRDKIWKWFNSVVFTRCHSKSGIVVVHCLTGDTTITMSDGTGRAIRDVRPGDEVATYKNNELYVSTVLNWANQGQDDVFEIKTASGTTVRANAKHPFLVRTTEGDVWVKVRDLRPGHRVLRATTESGKAFCAATTPAAHQPTVAGCAKHTTISSAGGSNLEPQRTAQKNGAERTSRRDMASHLRTMTGFTTDRAESAPSAAAKALLAGEMDCLSITATIPGQSADFCATPATLRSDISKQKLYCSPQLAMCEIQPDEIVSISPAGREDVFDIQIAETENFLANGLVSHNTRWHEDDLIGRLCDPNHPQRNKAYKGIADNWEYINIPAVVSDPALAKQLGLTLETPNDESIIQQFGNKPMSALWPERKSLSFLSEARRMDERTFGALYMGSPTREEGEYFKENWFREYDADEFPADLRIYGASDHAVSVKQGADPTVLGCVGVDSKDNIWVLPDLVWEKMQTDKTVEELLRMFKTHRPELWWMESELISKSFGPFLHKRMLEEKVYTTISKVVPSKDKATRARSIQGRMSMSKVFFPRFATWYPDAKKELLRFPYGSHDDFVDWLSHIGMGLVQERGVRHSAANDDVVYRTGSIQDIMRRSKHKALMENHKKATRGW